MPMNRLHLYLDTTIWNFPFVEDAPDKREDTLEFFRLIRWGRHEVYYSEVVQEEIERAPRVRRDHIMKLWAEVSPKPLLNTMAMQRLAGEYIKLGVFPVKSKADALHAACATVHRMDALVSWNFKHLANLGRRAKVNIVNIKLGYNHPLELVTPLEVMGDEKD